MSNNKIDWSIHYVDMQDDKHTMLGNIHTHGLNRYGHKELCMVLQIEPKTAMGILNSMGSDIAFEDKTYDVGLCSDVLQQGYNVELVSLKDDPVLYIVLPDELNRMPSDEHCSFPYNMQYEYIKLISEYTKSL